MPPIRSSKRAEIEELYAKAIDAIEKGLFLSVNKAADHFDLPRSTLHDRVGGKKTRQIARQKQQSLTSDEERTLVRWLTRLTRSGTPAAPRLAIEMATQIRDNRTRRQRVGLDQYPPLDHSWLRRFRTRHPEISGVWSRQIDRKRFENATFDTIKPWFDAVADIMTEHQYPPKHVYNMDESGFAVGTTQSSRVLVNTRSKGNWKVKNGRSEWITAIECVNAAGEAIPPFLIFKAKHLYSGWVPPGLKEPWRFSVSNSGWTSDSHGFRWISEVFDPSTTPEDPLQRRLLIMDGHSSHMTARLIEFCMNSTIDLMILPPHCSHILQPLDLTIFGPLKAALSKETDRVARVDYGRIHRSEWTQMYFRAREKALSVDNIQSGFKSAGLSPLEPMKVLEKLPGGPNQPNRPPETPLNRSNWDLPLLDSSPPDGTELRTANAMFNTILEETPAIPSPARRYGARLGRSLEMANADRLAKTKEANQLRERLNAKKEQKRGKRMVVEGTFVFTVQDVYEKMVAAEETVAQKKSKDQPKSTQIVTKIVLNEEDILEDSSSCSESE
jgi:hypothetical protein